MSFNMEMRRILLSLEEDALPLETAGIEILKMEVSWEQKAKAVFHLIQFEAGVDVGDYYPLPEEEKLVINREPWLKFDVTINYTADDWELYTTSEFAATCEGTAKELNARLETVLEDGEDSWLSLYRMCDNVLAGFRKQGANDTEPRRVLVELLRKLGMPEEVS